MSEERGKLEDNSVRDMPAKVEGELVPSVAVVSPVVPLVAPSKGFHFIVVPDNSETKPEHYTVKTLEELQKSLYEVLDRVERGWCWIFADGALCKLHMPRQVFMLDMPCGVQVALQPTGEEPVSTDGSFHTLRPVKSS
jgi:hypothetical protein